MAKIKVKSRRTVTKRFRVTKKGKIIRKHASTSHLRRKNDSASKLKKKRTTLVKGKFVKKVSKMVLKNK